MKNNSHTPLYIFSANDADLAAEFDATPDISRMEGCYKGIKEACWLCTAHTFHRDGIAPRLKADGQESVLFIDNQRGAWLRWGEQDYKTEGETYLGEFKPMDQTLATKREAWTRDPRTNTYWVAR